MAEKALASTNKMVAGPKPEMVDARWASWVQLSSREYDYSPKYAP